MVAKDKLFTEALNLRNTKGNLSGALEKVNQILSYDPDCIKAQLLKSTLLRDLGEVSEARLVLQAALEKIPEESKAFRADAYRLLGFLELLQADPESALQLAEQALETAKSSDDHEVLANVLALLGNIYHTKNKLKEAEDYYNQALAEAKRVRFIEREITVTINLANVYSSLGDKKKACDMLDDIWERTKGKWTKARFNALFEKTKIYHELHNLNEDLLNDLQSALQEAGAQGWADEQGNLALQLGLVYYDLDQPDLAREYLEKALAVFKKAKLLHKVDLVEKELTTKGLKD